MFRHCSPRSNRSNRLSTPARLATALVITLAGMPAAAHAQDVISAAPNACRALAENAKVRVVECTFRAGERDSVHTHPAGWYYVTRGGTLRVTFADGRTGTWAPKTGDAFWGEAEGPHTSANVGTEPMTFVLVELKRPAGEAAANAAATPQR